jgi:AcrR family transcriptional regulator
MGTPAAPRGTRPRNRRELIIAAAGELFATTGYPQVSMRQVAETVGVRPSALYRHVTTKQALLYEAVQDALTRLQDSLEHDQDDPVHGLATAVLAHRRIGLLWQREARYLTPEQHRRAGDQLARAVSPLAHQARRHQPQLDAPAAELLGWSAVHALLSTSFQQVQLPDGQYHELLTTIGREVITTEFTSTAREHIAGSDTGTDPPQGASSFCRSPQWRRDELLAAASWLFATRGFASVSIDDIGAATGIAGPSIYHHFPSKLDILTEALAHGADELHQRLRQAHNQASTARATLSRLLASYIDYSSDHRQMMDLLITEAPHLPEPERHTIRQTQHDYIATWVRLVNTTRPDLPTGHARVRVQATLNVINETTRTPHLQNHPHIEHALADIGRVTLGLPNS